MAIENAPALPAAAQSVASIPLALGLLVGIAGLATPQARLDDPDIMLHIVVGRWIVAHRAVPHHDVLSHTMAGAPWVVHEWLSEVVIAAIFDRLGWHGLVAMASLGLGLAVALFARALLRHYAPPAAIVIAAAAWLATRPHWLARPHILALPVLVLWIDILLRAREADRAPPPAAALLIVLWANLHATFLVGIGFAVLYGVEAVLLATGEQARLRGARQWSGFVVLALLAGFVTPNGIEAYLLPLKLLGMKFALSVLVEWKSVDFETLSPFELWLMLVLGVVLWRGIRLGPTRVFMVLLLFAMGLQHARNAELLAFIAPLVAAPDAGPQLARAGAAGSRDWLMRMARPAGAPSVVGAGLLFAAAACAATTIPLAPDNPYRPAAAVRAAIAAGIKGPVLNAYDYGDYLLFKGIKTFIDGRADLFGDRFIKRYYRATTGASDGMPALIDQYHIAWTIFPAGSPAVIELDHMKGWRRFYADRRAVVHVRARR